MARISVNLNDLSDEVELLRKIGKELRHRSRRGDVALRRLFRREGTVVLFDPKSGRSSPVGASLLGSYVSSFVNFWREVNGQPRTARMPADLRASLLDWLRATEGALPELRGYSTTPLLRPNGTIVTESGFDEATGYFFALRGEWPGLEADPDAERVALAVERLTGLVVNYQFAGGKATRAHAVAAVLCGVVSPFARLFATPSPGLWIDANRRGSGKSYLSKAIGWIATDEKPSEIAPSSGKNATEALERAVSESLARGNSAVCLVDNVDKMAEIGSGQIAAVLTSSRPSVDLRYARGPVTFERQQTIVFTSNNGKAAADALRRLVRVRVEVNVEKPEERDPDGFVLGDLVEHVSKYRRIYASDALVLLRAHQMAEDEVRGKHMSSFESWNRNVRDAVLRATGGDAWRSVEGTAAGDTREKMDEILEELLPALEAFLEVDWSGSWIAGEEALRARYGAAGATSGFLVCSLLEQGDGIGPPLPSFTTETKVLARILRGLFGPGTKPTKRGLGSRLRDYLDVTIDGRKLVLERDRVDGVLARRYRVERTDEFQSERIAEEVDSSDVEALREGLFDGPPAPF